jgi:hypothetical protein
MLFSVVIQNAGPQQIGNITVGIEVITPPFDIKAVIYGSVFSVVGLILLMCLACGCCVCLMLCCFGYCAKCIYKRSKKRSELVSRL